MKQFILILLFIIIVLFSTGTTVNLLLSYPVLYSVYCLSPLLVYELVRVGLGVCVCFI